MAGGIDLLKDVGKQFGLDFDPFPKDTTNLKVGPPSFGFNPDHTIVMDDKGPAEYDTPPDFPNDIFSMSYTTTEDIFKDINVNNFVKGFKSLKSGYHDPTYLGFNVMFDFHTSPLFAKDDINSASGYLNAIGDEGRKKSILKFNERLEYTNREMQWAWQTINGLDSAWTKYNNFEEPNRYSDDSIITINSLETIDLNMTGLIMLYLNSIYDFKYRREVVPKNLRYFDVYIFIQEIRNVRFLSENESTRSNGYSDAMINTFPRLMFKFTDCEFRFSDNFTVLESITNAGGNEFANNSMSFKYSDIELVTQLPWLDFKLDGSGELSDPDTSPTNISGPYIKNGSSGDFTQTDTSIEGRFDRLKGTMTSKIEQLAKRVKKGLIYSGANLVKRVVKDLVKRNLPLAFTNVYGKGRSELQMLTTFNVNGAVNELLGKNNTYTQKPQDLSGRDNAYSGRPAQNSDLSGRDNIFNQ